MKKTARKAVRKVATRHYELHEKKTLMWLALLFCVLGVLVIYSLLRTFL